MLSWPLDSSLKVGGGVYQVPEFLSRPLEWFRGRSNAQKVLIGAGVVIVLIAAFWVIQVMY
jgi:hypothetical protein